MEHTAVGRVGLVRGGGGVGGRRGGRGGAVDVPVVPIEGLDVAVAKAVRRVRAGEGKGRTRIYWAIACRAEGGSELWGRGPVADLGTSRAKIGRHCDPHTFV